jgi:hypothetical protein
MNDIQQKEVDTMLRAGTLTWQERDAIIVAISPLIESGYSGFRSRFTVSGFDSNLKFIIKNLLDVYVVVNGMSGLTEKEIVQKLNRAKGYTIKIKEAQNNLTRQVSFIYRQGAEDQVAKFIEFIASVFEALKEVCLLNGGHRYFQNINKNLIDDWIEELKIRFTTNLLKTQKELFEKNKKPLPNATGATEKKNNPTLTTDQIALIHFYQRSQITRDNAKEVAENNDHSSGEHLFQKYTYYTSQANRRAKPDPFSDKKLRNKIKLFESVLPHLQLSDTSLLRDEIKVLRNHLTSE